MRKQLYHYGSNEATGSNSSAFSNTWRIHSKISENFYILYRYNKRGIRYAPLFVQKLHFINNRHLTKSQVFLTNNPNPELLESVSDKLKWYRINSGILQRDVAKAIEVDRTTYARYEENVLEAYPLDKLSKAAGLFQIDVSLLLDEYNAFLYRGQGKQIKGLRKAMKLTQSQFAEYIKSPLGTLKKWEQEKSTIPKNTFKMLSELADALNNV